MYFINKLIYKMVKTVSKHSNRKKWDYKPPKSGEWMNVGTRYNEEWKWVDSPPSSKSFNVCVYELEDDYIIKLEDKPKMYSVECVHCDTPKQVERATRLLKVKYESLGHVIMCNSLDV